ncbi:methylmalonyl-CoA epimerase [Microbacterium sp. LRZ72]|uniref:VOC family protein n=1 Tax=Microbacterium sp. LRZ72 TaxID=2942481 RepID=UPI0029B06271|nr:methylmalonyl-CoA epimerase [Microbacterium sp. LRZ72]MDX2376538.1 methylmalonyl-CoA epimerase [Microbacterium sp. LRZ72]
MRLLQVAQRAEDLDRAAAFYARLLDAAPIARFAAPDLVFFEMAGVRLLLDREAPSAVFSFEVDNVHEAIERLGGEAHVLQHPAVAVRHEDDSIGPTGYDEWQSFIGDSEGNRIGLVSFQRP